MKISVSRLVLASISIIAMTSVIDPIRVHAEQGPLPGIMKAISGNLAVQGKPDAVSNGAVVMQCQFDGSSSDRPHYFLFIGQSGSTAGGGTVTLSYSPVEKVISGNGDYSIGDAQFPNSNVSHQNYVVSDQGLMPVQNADRNRNQNPDISQYGTLKSCQPANIKWETQYGGKATDLISAAIEKASPNPTGGCRYLSQEQQSGTPSRNEKDQDGRSLECKIADRIEWCDAQVSCSASASSDKAIAAMGLTSGIPYHVACLGKCPVIAAACLKGNGFSNAVTQLQNRQYGKDSDAIFTAPVKPTAADPNN